MWAPIANCAFLATPFTNKGLERFIGGPGGPFVNVADLDLGIVDYGLNGHALIFNPNRAWFDAALDLFCIYKST